LRFRGRRRHLRDVPLVRQVPAVQITAGPDGNLWFSLNAGHAIVRMTPTGIANVFPVPNPFVGGSQPEGITVGPDGNIWFADFIA